MTPTAAEQSLISQLHTFLETLEAKAHFKLTPSAFVLRYGYLYKPTASKGIASGTAQECFANATKLLTGRREWVYCEGFALSQGCPIPTRHAWVTDGSGKAFDNTWKKKGVAYAGVPLKSEYVITLALKYRAYVSMIDDWEHGWPLLRDLAHSPDEWLESAGAGYRPLQEGG